MHHSSIITHAWNKNTMSYTSTLVHPASSGSWIYSFVDRFFNHDIKMCTLNPTLILIRNIVVETPKHKLSGLCFV